EGAAPMLGRMRTLLRISADQSWFGKAPCGFWVMAGSVTSKAGFGQKIWFAMWAGWALGQKLARLAGKPLWRSGESEREVLAVGGTARRWRRRAVSNRWRGRAGIPLAKKSVMKTVSSVSLLLPLLVMAMAVGLPPMAPFPSTVRVAGLMAATAPSVWRATRSSS